MLYNAVLVGDRAYVLYYHKFTLSVYKANHLSVSTAILSYMIQNTVDVIVITNTKYQSWKANVKKPYIFICSYNDSSIDNEATAT